MYCSHFLTKYGPGVVSASDQGIVKVDIPDLSSHMPVNLCALPECTTSELSLYAAQMLQRYFSGERVEFSEIPVDLSRLTPFQYTVLMASRTLKFGNICSYGQLAAACGSPHAARAIGGALASNPVPIIIPCHRIVGADGRLTGYSAQGGENTKRELLKMEGVEFKGLLVKSDQMVIHSVSCR